MIPDGPAIKLDCSYPENHAAHHHSHPDTERLVCHICHPPAYVLRNNEANGQAPE